MIGVKICGVCRPADAAEAARSGATHLGVILAPGRRRTQSWSTARLIYDAAPDLVHVGVFVNPTADEVRAAHEQLGFDVMQLHGMESPELVRSLAGVTRVWKGVAVRSPDDVRAALADFASVVDGLLLDGFDAQQSGGAGRAFDWQQVARMRGEWPPAVTLIAAGGLAPHNVAAAIAALQPDIVDVSSGVEMRVCEKSADLIGAFIAAARAPHTEAQRTS